MTTEQGPSAAPAAVPASPAARTTFGEAASHGAPAPAETAAADRPLLRSILRGARNLCPNCADAPLFASWLRPVERCARCAEDYTHQRADDLPPYLTIFVVGHVVVAGYMASEAWLPLGSWGQLALWVPVTLLLSLALMRPFKGGTIGLQWALRMHGFAEAGHEGDEAGAVAGEPNDRPAAPVSGERRDRAA